MINGNVEGVRKSQLQLLENIYDIKVPRYSLATEEMINLMVQVTSNIDREVSITIDRKGNVVSVSVGDSSMVEIPIMDISERKLSGVRIIHTHPNGNSRLSALDVSALIKLKLDCISAVGVYDGSITDLSIGFCSIEEDKLAADSLNNLTLEKALMLNVLDKIEYTEKIIKNSDITEDYSEKAIIVGCDSEESLEELAELARACDIPVVYSVFQNRSKIDAAYYIGRGKVEEIALLRQAYRSNVMIFDDELAGSQVRNLEDAIGIKVIDRTTLILEIFARRAKTREAKIQVELAQLKYRLTRLAGLGTVLSRTGGGIGTRGPGEKKLETDRRHIKEKIYDLSNELEKIKKVREIQREKRGKQNIPQISLVGYTNAGKSTLRNALVDEAASKEMHSKDKVFEADMLFATLDTTTRAINLEDNRVVTVTDTVGFVRKLPHDLVEAFKSTLEEVIYSDLLLHVVDASSEDALDQIDAVENVLFELGALNKPTLIVLNKIDIASEDNLNEIKLKLANKKYIEVSAKNSINLSGLLRNIAEILPQTLKTAEFLIPYTEQHVTAYIHRNGRVMKEEFKEDGTFIEAQVDEEVYNKCKKYIYG
ncbi:GTPase HflX [Clostridium polynesiense]|uniref:GTPase HflX n=1 Tax=Clostridium polynesiense TaxID=1325933 RepID=UPI00058EA5B8|nr:GTPase HflX [Clostridium polynesiense]